jgi:hypothetical protein
MAYHERPRESLGLSRPVTDNDGLRVAQLTRDRLRRDRLEQSRNHLAADVRTRPEDSSPAIRRMLGYDESPRPPRRWETRTGWRADGSIGLVSVDAGPVDPSPAPPRRARA